MIAIPIEFTDFDGEKKTKQLYFNLTTAELAEMDLRENLTFRDRLQAVIDSNDGKEIVPTFKELVRASYGERVTAENGDLVFRKSEQGSLDFEQTAAYSEFFMRLVTDAIFSANWVNGVIPQNLEEQAARLEEARRSSMTPSERARYESEQRMQGHKKTQPQATPAPAPEIQQVEDVRIEEPNQYEGAGSPTVGRNTFESVPPENQITPNEAPEPGTPSQSDLDEFMRERRAGWESGNQS